MRYVCGTCTGVHAVDLWRGSHGRCEKCNTKTRVFPLTDVRWDVLSKADGSVQCFLHVRPGDKPDVSGGFLAYNPLTGEVRLGVDNSIELL